MDNLTKKRGFKLLQSTLVLVLTFSFFVGFNRALAQEVDELPLLPAAEESVAEEAEELEVVIPAEPGTNQKLELKNVEGQAQWQRDALTTAGLKFMIRGKEALAWTIGIEDAGFDNPAIKSSYQTVLTIVNSLFILGLLAIAVMGMFSIVIPRHKLRKVIFVYALAVIFVNFAFPANRLLIDGSNLLQKTFLTQNGQPIGIVDIVETPNYPEATSFQNETGEVDEAKSKNLNITLPNSNSETIAIGEIKSDSPTPTPIGGTLITPDGGTNLIQLNLQSDPQVLALNANQDISAQLSLQQKFKGYQEQSFYAFGMMILTGLAYLLMALIFVLRIVILWAFLILSPLLLLFGIFESTRGMFKNWLGLYGRWLLIGPLVALGISIVVNVWQVVGLPITSVYEAQNLEQFGNLFNIEFYLPGQETPNTLSTTRHMMEYLLFLVMLYLPIFVGFGLTRQKAWSGVTTAIVERLPQAKQKTETAKSTKTEEVKSTGVVGSVREFFNTKVGQVAQTAMPGRLTDVSKAQGTPIPSASSFLPDELALTNLPNLMKLLGANDQSRHSRETVMEKLANPEKLTDPTEQRKVEAVRQEIEHRAKSGNDEATLLYSEIQSKTGEVNVNMRNETLASPQMPTNSTTVIEKTIEHEKTVEKEESQNSAPAAQTKPLTPKELEAKEEALEDDSEENEENDKL